MHLFNFFQVSRADIEWYTGEDELPPYCEMTVKSAGAKEQRGDLQLGANLKGMETSPIIMIERPYQPQQPQSLTDPQPFSTKFTAGNSKIASEC